MVPTATARHGNYRLFVETYMTNNVGTVNAFFPPFFLGSCLEGREDVDIRD